jgi:NAD(P)-dependent dehydrogenase (short-subunit alcohol dehydrogenase family)
MDLTGKTVLITGVGSGIGEATARVFSSYGANVVGVDRDLEAGQHIIKELADSQRPAIFAHGDVRQEEDIAGALEAAVSRFGRLDFAVNNAGVEGALCSFADTRAEDFDDVISINLRGVFLCMKHELKHMAASGGGAIVNMSSVMGLIGSAEIVQYAASKHGVLGLTKSAAAEYAARNIRVNAICPGPVETRMVREIMESTPEILEPLIENVPAKRMAAPSEIGELAAWLCGPNSSYVNGTAIPIDGGYVAI